MLDRLRIALADRYRLDRELGQAGMSFEPLGYLNDSTAIGQEWPGVLGVRFDPQHAAPALDTGLTAARCPSVSATVHPATEEPAGAPVLWATMKQAVDEGIR